MNRVAKVKIGIEDETSGLTNVAYAENIRVRMEWQIRNEADSNGS